MPFLFIDYTNRILKAFEESRKANRLSQLLIHPTTANIKQECFNVYTERVERGEPEEENTLRTFFGVPPAGKNFGFLIEKCEPDRFRPLQKLITSGTRNPRIANVELLAWLIDFTPRPLARAQIMFGNTGSPTTTGESKSYSEQNNVKEGKEILSTTNIVNTGDSLQDGKNKISVTEKHGIRIYPKFKKAIAISLIGLTCFGTIYFIWKKERGMRIEANTGCMYWKDDHYEEIPCNDKRKDLFKLPLDIEKMKNFKKIMQEDTITERSIGKVYYIRIGNRIEYYTTSGNHPIDVTRPLKPLTSYMFEKHLLKQEKNNKDSLTN